MIRLPEVVAVEPEWIDRARRHHDRLTKPPGSLGRLEEVGIRLAAIQRRVPPRISATRVIVFAADHGITARERVGPYPREVTAQMVENFVRGGAAINALSAVVGAELEVVDVGVAGALDVGTIGAGLRFVRARVAPGTAHVGEQAAMTHEQVHAAIDIGLGRAEAAAVDGVDAVVLGEMGLGNTTIAALLAAALLGAPAEAVTGRGTGADDAMLGRKIAIVERALALHGRPDDPLELLRCLGGLELAALAGLCLGLAARRIAVVADGYITTAAVAVAVALRPAALDYLFAGHRSTEPGHTLLLERLGLRPLLELDMRLGEGTGGALALHVLRAAATVMQCMATFADAGVSDRTGP